jgi:TRAP-type C4-dicarboxylate transport system substrate-binding protein
MTIARRQFMKFAGAAVAAPAVSRVAWGQAPQTTLRLHHFLPPVSNAHSKLLVPWAKKIETDSGGRLKIDIFPSMQLGGTPPQLYDQARDGVADIVWTLPGSTPGRFPKIEVFELPFVANKLAVPNAKGVQDFYDANLRDEFKETHPICLWAHDHGLVHATRQIKSMDDMKGLKLRAPTRLAGEALKSLGANGIPMPIPQVPEALAQKVLDGCVIPWEVVPAIKVHELVKFHTEIFGSPTLYTATFVLTMNKPKYDALPADLKKVLDANSGQVAAEMAGKMWDEQAVVVENLVKGRGNTVTQLTKDESARWQKATAPVVDSWMKQAKDKGLNGEKLLADAKASIAKYARS